MQAERAAVAQAWRQVQRDRNEALLEVENLRQEIAKVCFERENSVSRLTADLADARRTYREDSRPQSAPTDPLKADREPLAASEEPIDKVLPQGAVGSGVSDSEDP